MTEAHDAELAQLREAHERSVSTLRGELEPKVIEARTLAEDRERLASKVRRSRRRRCASPPSTTRSTRRIAQLEEKHAAELAAQARTHAAELAAETGKRDAQILELQQAVRAAEARAQTAEDEVALLAKGSRRFSARRLTPPSARRQLEADNQIARGSPAARGRDRREARRGKAPSCASRSRRASARPAATRWTGCVRPYLEEGLAMLGALPPSLDPDEPARDRDRAAARSRRPISASCLIARARPGEHAEKKRSGSLKCTS